MKTGIEEYISIDQVITSVKVDLGMMGDSQYDTSIEKWINEAVRHTRSGQLVLKKNKKIEFEDGVACLPDGFKQLIAIRFETETSFIQNGDEVVDKSCNPVLIYDQAFAKECGCNVSDYNGLQNAYIVGDKLHVDNTPSGIVEAQISWIGTSTDSCGFYLIRPDFERACSAYARMKFLQAFPEVKGQITYRLLPMAQEEWEAQARWLRSVAARKNYEENKYEIQRLYSAWFTVKNPF